MSKLVYFDRTGVGLFSKRLEGGKFQWPWNSRRRRASDHSTASGALRGH
ncbi:IS66 family insertion sequence element accessory protein TnpB [Labrys sp. KB_33_2]